MTARHSTPRFLSPSSTKSRYASSPSTVENTHGRRLRLAADHRGLRIAVDDGVAHHVDLVVTELFQRRAQRIEAQFLAVHEGQELLALDRRRREVDQAGRRVDDVAGRED